MSMYVYVYVYVYVYIYICILQMHNYFVYLGVQYPKRKSWSFLCMLVRPSCRVSIRPLLSMLCIAGCGVVSSVRKRLRFAYRSSLS